MKPLAKAISSIALIVLSHSSIATAQAQQSQDQILATRMLYSMISLMADQNSERARSFIQTNFAVSADEAGQLIEISKGLKAASDKTNETFRNDVCANRTYYAEDKGRILAEARRRETESLGLVDESVSSMSRTLGAATAARINTWVRQELQPQIVTSNTESALNALAQARSIDGEALVATVCR